MTEFFPTFLIVMAITLLVMVGVVWVLKAVHQTQRDVDLVHKNIRELTEKLITSKE